MGRVVVITLTNKPSLVLEAISSVLHQTRAAVHVVARDACQDWNGRYPPAVFFNDTARLLEYGDYFCWLSDDDLLLENYVQDLAGYLDANPEIMACYGYSRHVIMDNDGLMSVYRTLPDPARPIVFGSGNLPGGQIDGGQVMMRREILDQIEPPFAPEAIDYACRVNDAIWMDKLAIAWDIYPVDKFVMVNRTTPFSAHTRPAGRRIEHRDWLEVAHA